MWEFRQTDPATWEARFNGHLHSMIRYDGRAPGTWGFWTEVNGYEYHTHVTGCFRAMMDYADGKS